MAKMVSTMSFLGPESRTKRGALMASVILVIHQDS